MKSIKIGRSTSCDYVINDSVVSSTHALITVSDTGDVYIEDLRSKNGTFVNGMRINTKKALSSSSTVLLGNHSIDWKTIIKTTKSKSDVSKPAVSIPDTVIEKKIIGRNTFSQIRFAFDDVSDKHAFLCKQKDGSVLLIDNNSTNGTFVNGIRISAPVVLRKGDNILLSNRHPMNWEAIYPPRKPFNPAILMAVAAAVIITAGVFLFKPWDWFSKDWSKIYSEHKNDVVLVYVKSAYAATVQGAPLSTFLNGYDQLDYCYIDGEGNISSGIARSSGTGFFISTDGKFLTNRHVVGSSTEEQNNVETVKHAIQSVLIKNNLSRLAAAVEVKYMVISVGIVQNDTYISREEDLLPCTILKTSDDPELDVAILQMNSKSLPNGSTYVDLKETTPS